MFWHRMYFSNNTFGRVVRCDMNWMFGPAMGSRSGNVDVMGGGATTLSSSRCEMLYSRIICCCPSQLIIRIKNMYKGREAPFQP